MKILILTGKFGMGHWSAAQALRAQLLSAFPQAGVEVEDLVAYAMPNASEAWYRAFDLLVTHGSGLFNIYYKMMEDVPNDAPFPLDPIFEGKLEKLLAERRPDAVIATHPLCARAVSHYKWETGAGLPLITSVTDMSAHSEWINPGTDCYLVGSPSIKSQLVEKGVERRRVRAAGIPVREEFKRPIHRRGDGKRRLLVMGGGLGLLPRKDRFYEELDAMENVETVIITGNNKKLFARLAGKYERIQVLGYTDRVYDYMARADLMLSKPGGITLFETIFSELPILAWEPFLQQEIENARFLVDAGIGRVVGKEAEDCLAAIRETIYDRSALDAMAANMRALKGRLEEESVERVFSALAARKGA